MSWLQRMIAHLADIFTPLIPAIVVGGLILGFRNIIGDIKMFDDSTKTLVDISQFWAGVHAFLWLIGEAIFHFLPVGITWSISKKMGTTQILGIVLGLTLVSPQLLNAYAVANTKASDIPFWDFGFAQVDMIGYQAQVIPAILAGFVLAYLERFLRDKVHNSISMIVVPFFALLPTVIIAHTILGPIRLENRFSHFYGCIFRIEFISWLAICCRFRLCLCTACHHRPASHDKRNRSSAYE